MKASGLLAECHQYVAFEQKEGSPGLVEVMVETTPQLKAAVPQKQDLMLFWDRPICVVPNNFS